MEFIYSNWLGIAGLVGTLFFGILSLVLYRRSVHKPIPAYGVYPSRFQIVDQSQLHAPAIEISYRGHRMEKENISAAMVYLWNAGNGVIRDGDVLTRFAVILEEDGNLIDSSIIAKSREVCEFSLLEDEPPGNRVSLNFRLMEFGDGVIIQLVYTGPPDTGIVVTGSCVGAERVTAVPVAELQSTALILKLFVLESLCVIAGIFGFVLILRSVALPLGFAVGNPIIVQLGSFVLGVIVMSGGAILGYLNLLRLRRLTVIPQRSLKRLMQSF